MPELEHTHTLLATLGGQPQIVTFTLDLLLQRNIPISEVIVIHPATSNPRIHCSLERLTAEFVGDRYKPDGRIIRLRSHTLRTNNYSIDDITNSDSADGVLKTLNDLVADLKYQRRQIHLSVTGGRRLISLLAISVAMLNFSHHDHIWHIYTPDAIQQQAKDEGLMHLPSGSGIELIEGPFVFLGAHLSHQSRSFTMTHATQQARMDAFERERCHRLVEQITPRQREVLKAFAHGLHPQQVAAHLFIEMKTVSSHTTRLLTLCRQIWNLGERLDYRFLQSHFTGYFDSL